MIELKVKGMLEQAITKLKSYSEQSDIIAILNKHGQNGIKSLASRTPTSTGLTASSWDYKVSRHGHIYRLTFFNANTNEEFKVAISLQYGHGTGSGGYVYGQDYINPAMKPIYDGIESDLSAHFKK